jgi:histidinol dehydrogenase
VALRLDGSDPDFGTRFAALLSAKRETAEDVEIAVRAIIDDVRRRGDAALIEYTLKFDRLELTPEDLVVADGAFAEADQAVAAEARAALGLAADRIEAFHRRQIPADDCYTDEAGVELGLRWTAIEAVGLYVPGGTAAYPSSVLMNAIPARVAGVERIAMVVPTPDGVINPLILVAARLAGVHEVYRVGGAPAGAAPGPPPQNRRPGGKIGGPGHP